MLALLALPAPAVAQGTPSITFDHYHTLAEIGAYLRAVEARYPDLVTLREIGYSRAGRPIWAVDINNPTTGPAHEKAGFYVDGNIHGGEVLGGEGALAFLQRLLSGYGSDPRITELVDTRAFYIVPIVNPDGRAISVDTPENHRWNIRPVDEDGDGLVDEDPPEDLDGDGRILQMRFPDPEGRWSIHPTDPRRMVRASEDAEAATRYRLAREGIDNDGDGRLNEDRVGGVDLNRNFPANWSAAQFASGPFPLSEPETHALVTYITDRPNIAAIHTFHTSGGLILRFPTLADQDFQFPAADIAAYRGIAEDGIVLTGYQNFADEKQTIVDLMSPGHGVFNDWGSKVFGVLAITTEMWAHAIGEGQDALFRWNDEQLGGAGFIDWYAYDHPQFGPVELGGWDRWSTASPPESMIAAEVERNVDWVLTFADKMPRVDILETSATHVEGDDLIRVEATVANIGWMATATTHAIESLETAKPVRVYLEMDNATVQRAPIVDLGVLPGTRGGEPDVRKASWTVRVTDAARPVRITAVVSSEKAGTLRSVVPVSGAAIVSVYTDLSQDVCTTLEYDELEASSTQACAGTHGYQLLVLDGDARQSVTVIDTNASEHELNYWHVITGGFSALGETAEWRVRGSGEAAAPIALIVRVNAEEWGDTDDTHTVSYLAVAKITPAAICVTDRIQPGANQEERARVAADTSAGRACLSDVGEEAGDAEQLAAGRYCYRLDDDVLTAETLIDVAVGGAITGRTEATIHDEDNGYFTSYVQQFAGASVAEPLEVTTWIEYDTQYTQEKWTVNRDRLETETHALPAVDCDEAFSAFHGYTLLGLDDESPIRTMRLELEPGVARVLSDAVVRGERDVYLLAAEGGQELILQISSVENNAVFDVVSPSGMLLVNETMGATVFLPHTGDYQIIVGGTRGNAGYELVAEIR